MADDEITEEDRKRADDAIAKRAARQGGEGKPISEDLLKRMESAHAMPDDDEPKGGGRR